MRAWKFSITPLWTTASVAVAAQVGVGVHIVRGPVRGPAGMADADLPGSGFSASTALQPFDPAGRLDHGDIARWG